VCSRGTPRDVAWCRSLRRRQLCQLVQSRRIKGAISEPVVAVCLEMCMHRHCCSRRVFGYFRCHECRRTWQSAYSWANCGQECKNCGINVWVCFVSSHQLVLMSCRKQWTRTSVRYPYRQDELIKNEDGIDLKKPHLSGLCEKCKQLGYSCQLKR
jgi:hypothetical protein